MNILYRKIKVFLNNKELTFNYKKNSICLEPILYKNKNNLIVHVGFLDKEIIYDRCINISDCKNKEEKINFIEAILFYGVFKILPNKIPFPIDITFKLDKNNLYLKNHEINDDIIIDCAKNIGASKVKIIHEK